MTTLNALIGKGQAGLTVYSPDGARSGLWGNLDDAIQRATGLRIARRQIIVHDVNSVKRFYGEQGAAASEEDPQEAFHRYQNMRASEIKYGHLVVKLLLSGESLLTIWQGEDAVKKLLAIKGKTQPADSTPSTLRGSFWCDNGVCNLMHSSDDNAALRRELKALKLEYWTEESVDDIEGLEPTLSPAQHVSHSGILCVAQTLIRLWADPLEIELPTSGDAHQTRSVLVDHLQRCISRQRHAPFIDAFLAGNLVRVTEGMLSLPFTEWERFVIQCSTVNQHFWKA